MLTSVFKELDRYGSFTNVRYNVRSAALTARLEHHRDSREEGTEMKKFGFATIAASGLAAAILGLAAPAQATTIADVPTGVVASNVISTDIGHHNWVNDIQQPAYVPRVDTSVHQSR